MVKIGENQISGVFFVGFCIFYHLIFFRAKSLRQFVLNHLGTHGVRLSISPYREQDWMTNYPLYAAERVVIGNVN